MTYHNLSAHSQKGNKHFIMENITNLLVALEWLVVFENIIFIGRSSKRVFQGFIEMIAKYIARIHSLGVNAKGNVIADRTCVIILMDVHP